MDKRKKIDNPSIGFNFLYMERDLLVRNKTPMTKYGCFLIPLIRSWNLQQPEVAGVLIISGLSDKMGKKNTINGEIQHSAGTSMILNDLYRRLSSFTNMLFLDVVHLKTHLNYRSMSEISILNLPKQKCSDHSLIAKTC